jgi:hypothetical protein
MLPEPVSRTEPVHGAVNAAITELTGSTALGAPRRDLFCFSVADGSHGAALRRARSKLV